jgi:uncharacterized membrane protein YcaP (DUF421 family)
LLLYTLKVALLFTVAIASLRLMGKSTLAQVTPHDLMAIVIIAALATNPILVNELSKTLLAIVLVTAIHILFAKMTLYKRTNHWILGEPTILVKHGKMIRENLAKSEMSVSELLATIRSKGFPDIRYVQYAILEPTGSISVLPQEDMYPVTPKELGIRKTYRGMALSLVVDGHIQQKNLELIGKGEDWLRRKLKEQGYSDIRGILYAAMQEGEEGIHVDRGDGGK